MTHTIPLDMLQSAGIGAVALLLGMFMTRKISWLQKFCIPSPVSGGIIFSLITLGIYKFCDIEVSFDGTLKDAFMLAFFTSVGFQSNPKAVRQGGSTLAKLRRTRQTLWSAVQMLTQKLCCQTIHDCPKVVPLHYESE